MNFKPLLWLTLPVLFAGCTVRNYPGDSEAARWMGYAAEENNAYAQYNYGLCCIHGDGVEKNVPLGMKYLRLAAANGYPEAAEMLKTLEKSSGENRAE